MERIGTAILGADMLVFATPLYYYGMSAQLKTVIDRFCALNGRIQRKHMKSALLSVAGTRTRGMQDAGRERTGDDGWFVPG